MPVSKMRKGSRMFSMLLAPHRRRTIVLVALVWFFCGSLYLLPYLLRGGLDFPAVLSHFSVSCIGLVFSIFMLALATRLQTLRGSLMFASYALTVVAVAGVLASVDLAVFESIYGWFGREHRPSSITYLISWAGNFAIFMSQFSLIAVAFWTLERLEAYRQQQVEFQLMKTAAVEAQNQASRAKLSALRYQLNPHFLFNTLNSISSLVMTGRANDAETMLAKLSEFLRTTLVANPELPQTLEGELETVDAYLGIERIRFGDRLGFDLDCPPELRDVQIPHFLLQPLVENAVKHGVAPSYKPITISICARQRDDELLISVENDCVSEERSTHGTGVGLRNVRERLQAVYGERGHLETIAREAGYLALLRVPIRVSF